MNAMPKPRPRRPTPIADHALGDIDFIRRTLERAGLTAFPGWGQVVIGATALLASMLAARLRSDRAWVTAWSAEAVLAAAIGAGAMALKARRLGVPMFGDAGRRFAASFTLPLVAGAALTFALLRGGLAVALPGTWMLLYGVAIATAGAFSIAAVRLMGGAFMLAGIATLIVAPAARDTWMAAAFGGIHVVFGVWIAGRHGG